LYVFEFPTSAVCAEEVLECVVTGPDGSQYDLSPLSLESTSWSIFDSNNLYEINVCRPVADGKCPHGSGVCVFPKFAVDFC
jgi:hypothetical protein